MMAIKSRFVRANPSLASFTPSKSGFSGFDNADMFPGTPTACDPPIGA